MATWLLDANAILYRLARDHLVQDPRTAHLKERLDTLDALLDRAMSEGHRLVVCPVVGAEALYVLEGYYNYSPEQASAALVQFLRAPEVVCEDAEAVLAGLLYHGKEHIDFVDGYLAARAGSDDVYLLTNDQAIPKRTAARVVEW